MSLGGAAFLGIITIAESSPDAGAGNVSAVLFLTLYGTIHRAEHLTAFLGLGVIIHWFIIEDSVLPVSKPSECCHNSDFYLFY